MSNSQPRSQFVPTVIENSPRGERGFDIYSRLLRDRIVFVNQQIDDALAGLVVAQLLFLDSEDSGADINMYVSSGGGSVTAGFAIIDTMAQLRCNVATIAMGFVGSMATVILAAGEQGKRFALPNSVIHFHPAGQQNLGGYAPDVEIHVRWMLNTQEQAQRLLAKYTGQTYERIHDDFQRDRFFTANEAQEYGLIDGLLESMEPSSNGHSSARLEDLVER